MAKERPAGAKPLLTFVALPLRQGRHGEGRERRLAYPIPKDEPYVFNISL